MERRVGVGEGESWGRILQSGVKNRARSGGGGRKRWGRGGDVPVGLEAA